MKNAAVPGETEEIFIGQGLAQERAEALKKRVEDELNMKATVLWIGPIVGTLPPATPHRPPRHWTRTVTTRAFSTVPAPSAIHT